jgi:hypothetical protein
MHGYDKKCILKFKNLTERDQCANTGSCIYYEFYCPFVFIYLFKAYLMTLSVLVASKETGLEGNVEKTEDIFRYCRLNIG